MRIHAFKCAAITLLLFAASLGGQLLFDSQPPPEEEANAVLGNARNLEIAYQQWKAQVRQNGADRKLVLPLGYSKGLSAEFTQAHGQAQLDLTDGTLSVEVSGLPNQDAFDLWLVDNGESSVRPEPGDRMLRIDRLQHGGASARLRARLGPEVLNNFKLDQIVVARAGKGPGEASILFGSPTLFQRLYYSEQLGQLTRLADVGRETRSLLSAPFSVLIPRPAHAAEAADVSQVLAVMVSTGENIFFEEKFNGNGRTCGTCHRKDRNFTIDPEFIATLPDTDALFVAEFTPELACNDGECPFENPALMRDFGLICENVDTFDQPCVMRGVPHTLALNTSLTPATSGLPEMIGWSADGSPNNTLKGFAAGAVKQHFTKTLNREPGNDFRFPTTEEELALEAFQRSLGRHEDFVLPLAFSNTEVSSGQNIFMNGNGDPAATGRCAACHNNAGALSIFGGVVANRNFNTGVEDFPHPAGVLPDDGGKGTGFNPAGGFGDGTFNAPTVVEAADTGPFFHNNAVETLEDAVRFFNTPAFNNTTVNDFKMTEAEISAVTKFLGALNMVENEREAKQSLAAALPASITGGKKLINSAKNQIGDAMEVSSENDVHQEVIPLLNAANHSCNEARKAKTTDLRNSNIEDAIEDLENACDLMGVGNACPITL